MNTTTRVPTGGYGTATGVVLTKSELTKAVRKYAKKYGYYTRTVRSVTSLKIAAVAEYLK